MKLGLLADIHEGVASLRLAIDRFASEKVDQIIVLGDVFTVGDAIVEVCSLLLEVGAVGVWGNHDYLLCRKSVGILRKEYSQGVATFMKSLRPTLVIEWCHFTHVLPSLDAMQPVDLWYLDGPPQACDVLSDVFSSVPHRALFCGHFHRWLLYTPAGRQEWDGSSRVIIDDRDRYFFVLGPAFQGCHSVFDLDSRVFQPFNSLQSKNEEGEVL